MKRKMILPTIFVALNLSMVLVGMTSVILGDYRTTAVCIVLQLLFVHLQEKFYGGVK